MSVEANKALIVRLWEKLYGTGDVSIVDEIVADDYLNHNLLPGEGPGADGVKHFVLSLRSAFPDLHFTVERMVATDDMVVTRWLATGTHQGDFLGAPATGRRMSTSGMTMHRIENGIIVEGWNNWDSLNLLSQIGVL